MTHLRPSLVMLATFTLLTGLAYPLAMTGVAQGLFPVAANGSLIERDGKVIGSDLMGQTFATAGYLHPRPRSGARNRATRGIACKTAQWQGLCAGSGGARRAELFRQG